ncbi:hypothetical protein C8Q75DRAFT_11364 [Abortiporus biennis]|nr:hypothetical protein C8Q75DRAFT_11364 [Abortiporus biennis]
MLRNIARTSLGGLPKHSFLFSSRATQLANHPDFTFFPEFLSIPEQRILLAASLQKLDATESRQFRRRRKDYTSQHPLQSSRNSPTIQSIFFPDECYDFSEGHYDGVIKRYREMHVSSWPEGVPGLKEILDKIHAVHPTEPSQTHLLHLASDGEIFPHVDNLGASGSWILGVSLGGERLLRVENVEDPSNTYELMLPSGSLYIQKDSIRFGFKHSVTKPPDMQNPGQRLSMMIRDLHD